MYYILSFNRILLWILCACCAIQQPSCCNVFLCISWLQLLSHYVRLPGHLTCAKSWGMVVLLTPKHLLHLLENILSPTTVKSIKGKRCIWGKTCCFQKDGGQGKKSFNTEQKKKYTKWLGRKLSTLSKKFKFMNCCLPWGLTQTHLPQSTTIWKK